MSTNSSDGVVQVDVHAAYSSALVFVDMRAQGAPSSITIYRLGVALVTLDNGGGTAAWYDHYPPTGSVSYKASADGFTSTSATVTIPAPTDTKTWLKGVDPNLSTRLAQDFVHPIDRIEHPKTRGIFRPPLAKLPVILEGPLGGRETTLTVKAYSTSDRDRVLALAASRRPVYYQPHPAWGDPARWVSLGAPTQTFVRLVRTGGLWIMSMQAQEVDAPTLSGDVVIPGWGWDQVVAAYGSWDAAVAARGSWIALMRQGVGA